MSEPAHKAGYIAEAWLVIFLSLLFSVGLAITHVALKDRIAQNKRDKTYQVVPLLVPGADAAKTEELTVVGAVDKKEHVVYRARAGDGTQKGWAIAAAGYGFADKIELLLGLDLELKTITGLYVLDQKETPGLGDNITDEKKFRGQFSQGKTAAQALVVRKGVLTDPRNEVLAVVGATVSSESVTGIINDALANLRDVTRAKSATGTSAPAPQPE